MAWRGGADKGAVPTLGDSEIFVDFVSLDALKPMITGGTKFTIVRTPQKEKSAYRHVKELHLRLREENFQAAMIEDEVRYNELVGNLRLGRLRPRVREEQELWWRELIRLQDARMAGMPVRLGGSQWTLEDVLKIPGYVSKASVDAGPHFAASAELVVEVQQAAEDAMRMLRVRGGGVPRDRLTADDWRELMSDGGLNETETRVIIDSICRPVLRVTRKVVAMERGFHGTNVASNVPDFTLYDSVTGKILGVIEAKRVGGDLQHAVRQMALQLITLQGAVGDVVQTRPLFGIATDGFRWAFLFLQHDRWSVVCHPAQVFHAVLGGGASGTRRLAALVSTLSWALEMQGFPECGDEAGGNAAPTPASPAMELWPQSQQSSDALSPKSSPSSCAARDRRRRGARRIALRFRCLQGSEATFRTILRCVLAKTSGCTVLVDGELFSVHCYVRKVAVVWWRVLRALRAEGNADRCQVHTLDVGGIPCPSDLDLTSKSQIFDWLCGERQRRQSALV